ncbi:hypothetical protein P7C70_g6544, partial [Phenoliferia sp. Uapishka_3]
GGGGGGPGERTTKRSMWRNVGFGRSSKSNNTSEDNANTQPSPNPNGGGSWGRIASGGSAPSPQLPSSSTVASSPASSSSSHQGGTSRTYTTNPRGLTSSPLISSPPSPPRLSTSNSNSKPKIKSPSISRSSSTNRLRSPSGSTGKMGQANKWLLEAQSVGLPELGSIGAGRKGAMSPTLGGKASVGLGLENDLVLAGRNGRGGNEEEGSGEEEDEGEEATPWSPGRGQHYTHDLHKGGEEESEGEEDSEVEEVGAEGNGTDDGERGEADISEGDEDEQELLRHPTKAKNSSTLSERRNKYPSRIATGRSSHEDGGGGGMAPNTAPFEKTRKESVGEPVLGAVRDRSWSDGDVGQWRGIQEGKYWGEARSSSSPINGGSEFIAGSNPEMTLMTSIAPLPHPTSAHHSPQSTPSPLPSVPTAPAFQNPFSPSPTTTHEIVERDAPSLGLEVVQESPVGVMTPSPLPSPGLGRGEEEARSKQPFPTKNGPTAQETLDSLEKMNRSKSSALDLHFSREDMIDKFLFASVTGNGETRLTVGTLGKQRLTKSPCCADEPYVTLFLIVYRRFVRPYDVVTKLIQRFEFVAGRIKTDPLLSRFAQMKLCGTLSTWFSYYPGDFSAPSTSSLLRPFLEDLLPRGATWVAHHAAELLPQLSQVSQLQDPEGSWALPDKPLFDPPAPALSQNQFRRPSLAPSYDSAASSSHRVDSSIEGNQSRLSVPGSLDQHESQSPSSLTNASYMSDDQRRSGSEAATSDSNERFGSSSQSRRGNKVSDSTLLDLSNALLELPEEAVAQQITRIAWGAFSHMTPRDLMRHVLAPRDPKNPRALLRDENSNVLQSINFVNYLADWVATMVLIQGKLKWRARIVEKFIHIAYQLRLLENFDSLMGVLAGLNSQPVFRLAETMETVNLKLEGDRTKIPKRLRSLNKLMATTKSFAAYRLALANSGTEMLPYLGVHLQDITVVNEVKSDMRDGKYSGSEPSFTGPSQPKRRIRQPRVVSEILGGILLGPTAFGDIPGFTKNIFPPASLSYLNLVATLGLVLFLFLVGMEVDFGLFRKNFKTNLRLLDSGIIWGWTVCVITTAFLAKFFGCASMAKWCGYSNRESAAVGSLMSCKGLIELIVLSLGLQAGVINQTVFSIFVLEALLLTFTSTPLTLLFYPSHLRQSSLEAASPSTHSIAADDSPTSVVNRTRSQITIVLERLENLGAVMIFTKLVASPPNLSRSENSAAISSPLEKGGSSSSEGPAESEETPLAINVVRLVELTDRTSAVMQASETDDTVRADPLSSLYATFASINGVPIASNRLSVVLRPLYADHIAKQARENASDLIVVPWTLSKVDSEGLVASICTPSLRISSFRFRTTDVLLTTIAVPNPFETFFDRAVGGKDTNPAYASFVRDVFAESSTDVGIFLDRGTTAPPPRTLPGQHHVFLPFFGGADDRAALEFVIQLVKRNAGISATVVQIKRVEEVETREEVEYKKEDPRFTVAGTLTGTRGVGDTIYPGANESPLQSESNDDVALELARLLILDDALPISLATNLGTTGPLGTCLERLKLAADANPNARITAVAGRGRVGAPSHRMELAAFLSGKESELGVARSSEVRRCLGEVGTAILVGGAGSNLFVLQSRGTNGVRRVV